MSESSSTEVLPSVKESFTLPPNDFDDDDEVVVVRRKKKSDVFSDIGNSETLPESTNPDLDESSQSTPTSSSRRRRRIQLDESSDEEDSSCPTEKTVDSMLNDTNNDSERTSQPTTHEDDAVSLDNGSEDSSDEDDESPPLRLFRKKNATTVTEGRNLALQDDDTYDNEIDDEGIVQPSSSEHTKRRSLPRKASMFALQSETQRLVRESSVNLPYHRPPPKKLSDFMKRPVIGNPKCDNRNKTRSKVGGVEHVNDDLPELDTVISATVTNTLPPVEQAGKLSNPEDKKKLPERPLTRRERLLKLIGSKLPQLKPRSLQKGPAYINFEEEKQKKEISTGVRSLMQRYMKHAHVGRENKAQKKEVKINIVRKEERSDGSGVELVTDVVITNTDKQPVNEGYNLAALKEARTPMERRSLLKLQLKEKMRKRREMERKRKEELHKLDNEEFGEEEEEEEEYELSGDESDGDDEEDETVEPSKIEKLGMRGNGIIETSDESEDDTQPLEHIKPNELSIADDVSQNKTVSDGSVLLYEDSTRSSISTACNKSGRITPLMDRTCSDDSFCNPGFPLRQPDVSNRSISSHFPKRQVSKGEFDDTYFESDSQSQSRPFRLDFEPSQSQFLDADGFIRQDSLNKTIKKGGPLLPPGAEDDNAVSDCNMSQLLGLCSAPFDTSKVKSEGTISRLFNRGDSSFSNTEELLGLCTGGFSGLQSEVPEKKLEQSAVSKLMNPNDSIISNTEDIVGSCSSDFPETSTGLPDSEKTNSELLDVHESTRDLGSEVKIPRVENKECDVSNIEENSGDMFQTAPFNESFGFNVLSGTVAQSQEKYESKDGNEADSDDDDEPITIIRTKKKVTEKILREFLEEEAELSGSDKGSDDEDEVGPDGYESDEPVEVLPEAEVINRQLDRVHRKQVLEEDQKAIELLQEAFMGGEEIAPRERKFRWRNIDENITPSVQNSDDDDADSDSDWEREAKWRKMRMEREEFIRQNPVDDLQSEDSLVFTLGRQAVLARQNSIAREVQESSKKSCTIEDDDLIDVSSVSLDGFNLKKRVGSFLNRPKAVLAKLANFKDLKYVNGPKNTDKMLFKVVSPKVNKQSKRKTLSDVGNTSKKQPATKKLKLNIMNEDSNSVFDYL